MLNNSEVHGDLVLRPTHEPPPRHQFEGQAILEGIRFWFVGDGTGDPRSTIYTIDICARPHEQSSYNIGVGMMIKQKGIWSGHLKIWDLKYEIRAQREQDEKGWHLRVKFVTPEPSTQRG